MAGMVPDARTSLTSTVQPVKWSVRLVIGSVAKWMTSVVVHKTVDSAQWTKSKYVNVSACFIPLFNSWICLHYTV